jgi:hypothetical protein
MIVGFHTEFQSGYRCADSEMIKVSILFTELFFNLRGKKPPTSFVVIEVKRDFFAVCWNLLLIPFVLWNNRYTTERTTQR